MSATFVAELVNEDIAVMRICFDQHETGLAFDVFNLTFGPVNSSGAINILAKIRHEHLNRLFSTILLQIVHFLQRHPGATVGMDGSTEGRAYLYHRIFLTNESYINRYCEALGMDWYVRWLRSGEFARHGDGYYHMRPIVENIPSERKATDMYRYYLVRLKDHIHSPFIK
ncbi:DUF6934 family protein [Chitinophaga sp. NPDC101104]|uniref:DUF6934 family protein n=1 Tax=Chitinophaga sp. NPDC101104 TaxID=3390561 RepID=UPI003D031F2A